MIAVVSQRSRTKAFILVVLLLVLAVVGSVSFLGWRQTVPAPSVSATLPHAIGQKADLAVVVEAHHGQVALVEVRATQGMGKPIVVARKEGALGRRAEVAFTIEPAAVGLREGPATLEVWTRDDFWRPLRPGDTRGGSFPVAIDLTPPKLEIVSATPYLAPGGAGLVVFRATEAAQTIVSVGSLTFPSFPIGPPERNTRVAFVALPWDFTPGTALSVVARDEAGNTVSRGIPAEILPRRFKKDVIDVKDTFLQAKVPELLPQHPPSQSLVDAFLVINRDLRKQAEDTKRTIAAKTADKPLWEGPFVQPRNTKVFANFAETRTYVYGGRDIDTQVHLGYDLAATKQMPVPAANKGVVVYAAPLTIYGNAVVVDHGLGLMTLYGHMSSIEVKVGDAVEKGQELGRSGMTGLAMGDHLHYEVLVNGISVTPLEWWDAKWIRDRITGPLHAAGVDIAGADAVDEAAAAKPAAPATPHRRVRRR